MYIHNLLQACRLTVATSIHKCCLTYVRVLFCRPSCAFNFYVCQNLIYYPHTHTHNFIYSQCTYVGVCNDKPVLPAVITKQVHTRCFHKFVLSPQE